MSTPTPEALASMAKTFRMWMLLPSNGYEIVADGENTRIQISQRDWDALRVCLAFALDAYAAERDRATWEAAVKAQCRGCYEERELQGELQEWHKGYGPCSAVKIRHSARSAAQGGTP